MSNKAENLRSFPNGSYEASFALIFYKREQEVKKGQGKAEEDQGGNIFWTSSPREGFMVNRHDIIRGELGAGKPISKQAIIDMAAIAVPRLEKGLSFMPEHVLAYSQVTGGMAWWTPAKERKLFFAKRKGSIKSGLAPVPPLLFRIDEGHLHVWALKENKRPTPNTKVFHAPFYNVTNGSVCMGNVETPREAEPENTRVWEDLFFGSEFTGEGEPQLKGIKGKELWSALIDSGKKTFPVEHLVACGTVKEMLVSDW